MIKAPIGNDGWKNPSIGTHLARCIRITDIGSHESEWMGKVSHKRKVYLEFEIPGELLERDGAKEPFIVRANYTLSMGEKSNLRKDLENWRGRKFSEDEAANFDLASVIGKPAMITLSESKDKKFVNISSVTSIPKGMECPANFHETWEFSIDEPNFEVFKKLTMRTRLKISSCLEWANKSLPPEISVLLLEDKKKAQEYGQ